MISVNRLETNKISIIFLLLLEAFFPFKKKRILDGHIRFGSSVSPLVSSQKACEEARPGFYSRLSQPIATSRVDESGNSSHHDTVVLSNSYKQRLTSEQRLPIVSRLQQRRNLENIRVLIGKNLAK